MTFEIKGPYEDGYVLMVNGATMMECLSRREVEELTFGEIIQLLKVM